MDAQSSYRESVSEDHCDNWDSLVVSQNGVVEDWLENNLEHTSKGSLQNEDVQKLSELDDNVVTMLGDRFINLRIDLIKSDQKSLNKSATFPCSDKMFPSGNAFTDAEKIKLEEDRKHLQDKNPPCTRSTSLPTLPSPVKLVSAMKGSREKNGIPPQKLNVSWTPDVYDPTPTIVSHTVRGKKLQKSSKKKGRTKEKANKVSRGSSSSKDKKLFRRMSGGSDKCYRSMDGPARSLNPDGHSDAFLVGSPDSYCGDSFLKESLIKVHMSVTEAL